MDTKVVTNAPLVHGRKGLRCTDSPSIEQVKIIAM